MAIENRNLKPGMKLMATFKKKSYTAEVVQTDEGLRIKTGGKLFKSVSAAGSHVMGGTACNGWRFWSLEGEAAPAKPVKKSAAKAAKAPAKKTAVTSSEGENAPEAAPVAPGASDGASGAEEKGSPLWPAAQQRAPTERCSLSSARIPSQLTLSEVSNDLR